MAAKFPTLRTNVPALEPVIRAWSLSHDQHQLRPGASQKRIAQAEAILRRRIPLAVRAIYEMTDGAGFVDGNLIMYPVLDDAGQLCVAHGSDLLRSWRWGIPNEVVVFGSDGSESEYGIWLPKSDAVLDDAPVVEIAEANEDMKSMAVVGTSFAAFAKIQTAYYLSLYDLHYSAALDALGLPSDLRRNDDPDDELFADICRWADPGLPRFPPDPAEAPVGLERLQQHFGRGVIDS